MQRRITIHNLLSPSATPIIELQHGRLAGFIERFIDKMEGEFDRIDILVPVSNGKLDLWLICAGGELVGFATTEYILRDGRGAVCHVVHCGGERAEEWVGDLVDFLEKGVARERNCDTIRMVGRLGWTKLLPDWKTKNVVMEKRL